MLKMKYPELEKPVFCARRMSVIEKWRNIQFHKNLWKVDERMLRLQWEMDAREEGLAKGLEEGLVKGLEQGLEQGREEGLEQGLEQGQKERNRAIAKNLLSKGSTPEFVHEITGLDLQTVQELAAKQG
jgi:predicted transposase/invertase (TIGR01784 family)